MNTTTITGREFRTYEAAREYASEAGRVVIAVHGLIIAVTQDEADRAAAERVSFAYLTRSSGTMMTVPVT